jgi:hypothetical protein
MDWDEVRALLGDQEGLIPLDSGNARWRTRDGRQLWLRPAGPAGHELLFEPPFDERLLHVSPETSWDYLPGGLAPPPFGGRLFVRARFGHPDDVRHFVCAYLRSGGSAG